MYIVVLKRSSARVASEKLRNMRQNQSSRHGNVFSSRAGPALIGRTYVENVLETRRACTKIM
jgi:hypothetical protein